MKTLKEEIKALLTGKKTVMEDDTLLQNKVMNKLWVEQWENTSGNEDKEERDLIWTRVHRTIHPVMLMHKVRSTSVHHSWKVFALVASFLLILTISGTLYYFASDKDQTEYIVYSGNQHRETIQLSDGTKVELGAGSRLSYPKSFRGDSRRVELDGQAFFEVTKNPDMPFIVQAGITSVTVLGTSFEMFTGRQNGIFETILLSGKVKVDYHNIETQRSDSYMLYPDQKITISLHTGEAKIQPENAAQYSAWRNYNGLCFTSAKLSDILPRLERWYGCKITCHSDSCLEQRLSFKIKGEPIDKILDFISQSSEMTYQEDAEHSIYTLSPLPK